MDYAMGRHASDMGHEAPAFALLKSADASADAVVRTLLSGSPAVGKPGQPRLGLGELPERIDRLATGMVYGLACDQQAVRLPLIANAILASVRTGKRCALLATSDPAVLLRKFRLAGFALEATLKRAELDLFEVSRDAAKQLFRLGADALLAQLDKNIPERDVLVVFDEADALFQVADLSAATEATQRYLRWAAARQHTVLAMFAPAPLAPRDYLNVRRIAESFGGFGVSKPASGGALLDIRHWFGPEGASARECYELRLHGGPHGMRADMRPPASDELPPVDALICAADALGSAAASKSCEVVGSLADALDAARRCDSARLVLPFAKAADFLPLCRAVSALRALGQPTLRVMVRERGLRLRAAESLALLRLGTSSIIPADVPDAAAKRMADALQGTRFARPYDSEVEHVLAETTAVLGRRMQNGAFCDAVERLLAAADGFDVPSSLVRIQAGHAEAARLLARAGRNGRELLGFAQQGCAWLFLFGCLPDAAPRVLQRIFGGPQAEVSLRWDIRHEPEGMLAALRELRR
jgi:hypothetical protein